MFDYSWKITSAKPVKLFLEQVPKAQVPSRFEQNNW